MLGGFDTVYEIGSLKPIINRIREMADSSQPTKSERVIADHIRSATHIIGDDLGVVPSNLDQGYVVRRLIRLAIRHVTGCEQPLEREYDWYVLLALQTSGSGIDLNGALQALLESAYEQELIHDAVVASSEVQTQKLWKLREGIVEGQLHEGGSIKHDVSVPVSKVPEFILNASEAVQGRIPGIRPCAFGHVGDGNIHFNLSQPVDMDTTEFLSHWEEINLLVHDLVEGLGGSFSAEHGVGMLKLNDMHRYKDRAALAAMQAIKRALDPHNLFNPGKVLPPF